MSSVKIKPYTPTSADYMRVDDLLTHYSKSRGGVDYKHVAQVFADSATSPKVRCTADFLSWGCVTIDHIEILDQNGLEQATERLLAAVRTIAYKANMASLVVENSNPSLDTALTHIGLKRSNDIHHHSGQHKNFYVEEISPTNEIDLEQVRLVNRPAKEEVGVQYTHAQAFKATNEEGQTLGELMAFYTPLGELEIERIYINPDMRGNGVGRKLMKSIEKFAKDMNMRSIIVASPTWQQGRINDDMGGFYEACDYERLVAIPLNLTTHFNGPQYNVYYKKDLKTTGLPIVSEDHLMALDF